MPSLVRTPPWRLALWATCLVLAACSGSTTRRLASELDGALDLALVGDALFVTSANRSELQVLDLRENPNLFVPAPNPLEALVIPVLPRPTNLARDVAYGPGSAGEAGVTEEVGGPYVYARSAGGALISVVWAARSAEGVPQEEADRWYLREVKRVREPGGPVTAFAARAPAAGGQPSTLFYAVQEGEGPVLKALRVPGRPEELSALADPGTLTDRLELAELRPPGGARQVVTALLVMPQAGQLVVATRSTGAGQQAVGATYLVTLAEAEGRLSVVPGTLRTLNFGPPGSDPSRTPVRFLATHGDVPAVADPDGAEGPQVGLPALTAGQRIYAIVDEASCDPGQARCAGVVAVDTSSPQPVRASYPDLPEQPMLPIDVGGALPTGLSLFRWLAMPGVAPGGITLAGIVPASDGEIYLFDAHALRQRDRVAAAPALVAQADAQGSLVSLRTAQGTLKRSQTAFIGAESVTFTDGKTLSEAIRLRFEGEVPTLRELQLPADRPAQDPLAPVFPVPLAAAADVRVGDRVILLLSEGTCPEELTVTAVPLPTAAEGSFTTGPLPPSCTAFARFTVRAGAASGTPFVVVGDGSGYMGRAGPSQTFSFAGEPFHFPLGSDPRLGARIEVRTGALEPDLVRDDFYLLQTTSNFAPTSFEVDNDLDSLARYRLPSAVAYYRSPQVPQTTPGAQAALRERQWAYIAYPSADGILQVVLRDVVPGVENSGALFTYE